MNFPKNKSSFLDKNKNDNICTTVRTNTIILHNIHADICPFSNEGDVSSTRVATLKGGAKMTEKINLLIFKGLTPVSYTHLTLPTKRIV